MSVWSSTESISTGLGSRYRYVSRTSQIAAVAAGAAQIESPLVTVRRRTSLFTLLDYSQAEVPLNCVLGWLLESSQPACVALLCHLGVPCDPRIPVRVLNQPAREGAGRPDLTLEGTLNDKRKFCVALELKLGAALTKEQESRYSRFLDESGAAETLFRLVAPRRLKISYPSVSSAGEFLPVEDVLEILAQAGGHLAVADFARDMAEHFVDRSVDARKLIEVVRNGPDKADALYDEVRKFAWQLKEQVIDSSSGALSAGPLRWGAGAGDGAFYGFFLSAAYGAAADAGNLFWLGFWDLQQGDGPCLTVLVYHAQKLLSSFVRRTREFKEAQKADGRIWTIPLSDGEKVRPGDFLERGLGDLIAKICAEISDLKPTSTSEAPT